MFLGNMIELQKQTPEWRKVLNYTFIYGTIFSPTSAIFNLTVWFHRDSYGCLAIFKESNKFFYRAPAHTQQFNFFSRSNLYEVVCVFHRHWEKKMTKNLFIIFKSEIIKKTPYIGTSFVFFFLCLIPFFFFCIFSLYNNANTLDFISSLSLFYIKTFAPMFLIQWNRGS